MGGDVRPRVGVVGAGAMGGAIARGLVDSGAVPPAALAVADPSGAVRADFAALGVGAFPDGAELLAELDPDVVVLAVKPQVLPAVARGLADSVGGRLVASVAAGVTIAALEAALPGARVVRCMPNLPMQARSGAVAVARGTRAGDDDVELVCGLLSHLGVARVMREDQLDVAGVVSGCAPALFALFVDCLTRAGVEAGMTADDCRSMVEATMRGTAEQLLASGEHPRAYMERVSSPGGTTIAALRAMEGALFSGVCAGVDAARARTAELAHAAGGGAA